MKKKRKAERETDLPERDKSWKVRNMVLSLFAVGAELAMCQRCCGRTAAGKDGDDGRDAAAGISG